MPIVVISWWSNCLALACLRALVSYDAGREILVVQVGKSELQRQRFRDLMPSGVEELRYSPTAPAEHSRVIEDVAMRQLRDEEGVWFIDHDVIVHEPLGPWLRAVDGWLLESPCCLCLPPAADGPAITQPAFWISPRRWPAATPPIDPVPFHARDTARRPDLFPSSGELRMPEKDTLVSARDELLARGQAAVFPRPFPNHSHLGGLSLFTGPTMPAADAWVRSTVVRFTDFFDGCPPEWIGIEEPTLLRRCGEFRQVLGV